MEDMKELMDGKYEIIERYLNRITKISQRIGWYNAQVQNCDVKITGCDSWEQCKYYINKRNMMMSCKMAEQGSLHFYTELLNEYINV